MWKVNITRQRCTAKDKVTDNRTHPPAKNSFVYLVTVSQHHRCTKKGFDFSPVKTPTVTHYPQCLYSPYHLCLHTKLLRHNLATRFYLFKQEQVSYYEFWSLHLKGFGYPVAYGYPMGYGYPVGYGYQVGFQYSMGCGHLGLLIPHGMRRVPTFFP